MNVLTATSDWGILPPEAKYEPNHLILTLFFGGFHARIFWWNSRETMSWRLGRSVELVQISGTEIHGRI